MSETDFNSVPVHKRPELETLVSSQAVTALRNQLTAAQSRVLELEREASLHEMRYRGAYETAEKNLAKALELEHKTEKLTADNARLLDDNVRIALERDSLRESIQSVLGYAHLPQRYRDELEAAIESPHDAT